jgi:hypothetical protein
MPTEVGLIDSAEANTGNQHAERERRKSRGVNPLAAMAAAVGSVTVLGNPAEALEVHPAECRPLTVSHESMSAAHGKAGGVGQIALGLFEGGDVGEQLSYVRPAEAQIWHRRMGGMKVASYA